MCCDSILLKNYFHSFSLRKQLCVSYFVDLDFLYFYESTFVRYNIALILKNISKLNSIDEI